MTFVITGGCCSDSSCIPVCPVQCIRPRPGDPDFTTAEQLYIDPSTCIDCGACMDECPVNAIHSEWELPDELADYVEVNSAYFEENPIEEALPPDFSVRKLPADSGPLSVAIVGSGPAACYTAAELSELAGVTVSVFERLPTPFGLIRAGVAPDHANTKLIADRFNSVLSRPNVHCFFNVEVGVDLTLEELLEHHHAVVWAGGANGDRRLGLPGEDLPGSHSAREFVAWYNSHPDHADDRFELGGERVIVLGNGNVALDVARILAQPVDRLRTTDIADHAIEALGASSVREVVVAARRAPSYAAYSASELASLERVDGVSVHAVADDLGEGHGANDRRRAVIERAAERASEDGSRSIVFRYRLTPVSINGDDRVRSVTFERADGQTETIEADLVLRAVGYRGTPVAGLPFDAVMGTLPHRNGRVIQPESGYSVEGIYCAGWIKRGATGVIGSNKVDAAETVTTLLDDFVSGRLLEPKSGLEELKELVAVRKPDFVGKEAWALIDQAERRAGRESGRPRAKLATVADLLATARAEA